MPRSSPRNFVIRLWDAEGKPHWWRVRFCQLPKDRYGDCSWADKEIRISCRLRHPQKILSILRHEIIHASAFHALTEEIVMAIQRNLDVLDEVWDQSD